MQTSHKPLAPANACLKLERRHCEERSEAIHSFFARQDGLLRCARNDGVARARNDGAGDGLLRGACHRARIRATRWLAMTAKHTFTPSRREASEALIYLPPKEGVGNAGCPWHPQPRVRLVLVEAHE